MRGTCYIVYRKIRLCLNYATFPQTSAEDIPHIKALCWQLETKYISSLKAHNPEEEKDKLNSSPSIYLIWTGLMSGFYNPLMPLPPLSVSILDMTGNLFSSFLVFPGTADCK